MVSSRGWADLQQVRVDPGRGLATAGATRARRLPIHRRRRLPLPLHVAHADDHDNSAGATLEPSMGDEGATELAAALFVSLLSMLGLAQCGIGDPEARALAQSLPAASAAAAPRPRLR